MFTGIIEDLGTVESLKPTDQGAVISVHTSLPISEITIGDSITVNGACLTVISKSPGRFAMDVSAETLRCTGLGDLKPGSRVNLERCLTLGKLLGGHLVSGHVDGVGRVVSIKPEGDSKLFTFEVAPAQARYLVEKGSVGDRRNQPHDFFDQGQQLFGRGDSAHAALDHARLQAGRRLRQHRERHAGQVRRENSRGASRRNPRVDTEKR